MGSGQPVVLHAQNPVPSARAAPRSTVRDLVVTQLRARNAGRSMQVLLPRRCGAHREPGSQPACEPALGSGRSPWRLCCGTKWWSQLCSRKSQYDRAGFSFDPDVRGL